MLKKYVKIILGDSMKNKKGFTLAELLGVIVILLLLVLIVTPIFINYTKKASKSAYVNPNM